MCVLCEISKGRHCNLLKHGGCLVDFLKNVEFEFKSLSSCFPLSRKEKFEETIRCGNIDGIWLVPGHVFILNSQTKQLLTFDCKPAHLQQFEDTVFLDLTEIQNGILDIVTTELYPKTVFIIFKNGALQIWKFTDSHNWSGVVETMLPSTGNSEIISICVHSEHKAVYWCEKKSGIFSICKRDLPKDIDELEEKSNIGNVEVVLSNCPASDVFHFGDFVSIITRPLTSEVQLNIILRPSSDHLILFIGGSKIKIDSCWTNQEIDFRNIILQCLPMICQSKISSCNVVTIYDSVSKELVSIAEDRKVFVYHVDQGEIGLVTTTSLQMPPCFNISYDNCFISNGFLGIWTNQKLRIYSLHVGQLLKELTMPEGMVPLKTIKSVNPIFIGGVLTSSDIQILQKLTCTDQLVGSLSDSVQFQTDALNYAHFSQNRSSFENSQKKLEELKIKWEKDKKELPSSQLRQTIAPFIEEFWRLENISDEKYIENNVQDLENLEVEVNAILTGTMALPLSWQHSQLMLLSDKYPQLVMDVIFSSLNIQHEHVSDSEMGKWKKVLGLDITDPGSQKTFIFNHICRSIFKLQPEYLLKFVKMAQIVSERNIGVSAFVRKRHLLQYYQKALDCLPEPSISAHPKMAVQATAQLILACGDKNCVIKAVKYLIRNEQWSEIFQLLDKDVPSEVDVKQRSMLVYLLVTALSRKGVLTQFSKDLSHLVPHWKSCINVEDVFDDKQPPLTTPSQPAVSSIQPLLRDLFTHI